MNVRLERRCPSLWDEIHHPDQPQLTVAEVWAKEHAHLMRMPTPFDGFVEHTKRVSPTCLIAFERNRYSVQAAFENRPVSVGVYAESIVIAAEGKFIAQASADDRARARLPVRANRLRLAPLPERPPTKTGRVEERRSLRRASPTFQAPPGGATQATWRKNAASRQPRE